MKKEIAQWMIYSLGATALLAFIFSISVAVLALGILVGFFAGMFNAIRCELRDLNKNIIGNRSEQIGPPQETKQILKG